MIGTRPPPVERFPKPPRNRVLVFLECVSVAVFVGLCVGSILHERNEGDMIPIDPAALTVGPGSERWMGIYYEDQPVGFAVTQEQPTKDGGVLVRGRTVFRMVSFGEIQRIVSEGSALIGPDHALKRFELFWDAGAMRLVARGEVRGNDIVVEIDQGGDVQEMTLPFEQPPQIDLSLATSLARESYTVGQRFDVPFFDPVTLTQATMEVVVTDLEILPDGEEAYWLTSTFAGVETRRLVTPDGETIREESGMGLRSVRLTREEAEALAEADEPADIIRMTSIPLRNPIPSSHDIKTLVVDVSGVELERIPEYPPIQTRVDARVTIRMPVLAEIPHPPLLGDAEGRAPVPPEMAGFLEATPTLPVVHPEIVEQAKRIIGAADNRRDAAMRINDWVFTEIEKRPVVGVPNGLQVLRSRQGDCNEHTALFVSLARAAGIPARIAAGVVYSDHVAEKGAFYYHAWPEVHLGDPVGWVPVDPTFGEFPADATHIKLAEGDLDRQIEIIGVMGRLRLEGVEAR